MKDVKPILEKGPKPLSYSAHDSKTRRLADDWRAEAEAYYKSLGAPYVPETNRH